MKKLTLALVLLVSMNVCSWAQQDPTAEQIVSKYANLCAEKGYLDTIRTTRIQAYALSGSDSIKLTILKDAGRGYYTKIATPNGDQVRVYREGKAMMMMGEDKQAISDKKELDDMKLQSHILPDMVYKKLGYKMTLEGISKRDGVEYHVVKLVSPNGYTKTNYYETETGLLRLIYDQNGVKVELLDYVKFKGGLYARKNVLSFPDGNTLEIYMTDMVNNEPIDASLFKL